MQTVSDGDTLHKLSGRCKENIINLSSAEFTPRVVKVKKIDAFTFGYHFSKIQNPYYNALPTGLKLQQRTL